jgi:hypothetical protein
LNKYSSQELELESSSSASPVYDSNHLHQSHRIEFEMATERRSEPAVAIVMDVLHYSPSSQARRKKKMGFTRVSNQMKTNEETIDFDGHEDFNQT